MSKYDSLLDMERDVNDEHDDTYLLLESRSGDAPWWNRRTRLEKSLLVISSLALIAFVALAVVFVSDFDHTNRAVSTDVSSSNSNKSPLSSQKPENDVCLTPGCVKIASHYLEAANLSVDPCDDFYEFTCGQYERNAIIPDHETSSTAFQAAEDDLNNRLRVVLEEKANSDELAVFSKVRDFYSACMNKTEISRLREKPLIELIDRLGGWPVLTGPSWDGTKFDWTKQVFMLRETGASFNYLLDFSVSVDSLNSSTHTIEIDEPSLGMPGRTYLLKGIDDPLVKKYTTFMVQTAVLLGANEELAKEDMRDAVLFEIQLANLTLPKEERRNYTKLYNKMTLKEFSTLAPKIDWVQYANNILLDEVDDSEVVVVVSPKFVRNMTQFLEKVKKRTVANYMMWRVVMSTVGMLDDRFRSVYLDYIGAITGQAVDDPRWRICLAVTRANFGNAIGSMYVRKYFDESARDSSLELVNDIRKEFDTILEDVEWMDDVTRKKALIKVADVAAGKEAEAVTQMIAYPVELLNDTAVISYYDNITVTKDDFFNSALDMKKSWTDFRYKKLRKPYIRNDWRDIGAVAVVNAYYSPTQNLIMFPAGILQGVFFANDRPKYINYGAIGFVIGHEITHGFDDQGRQFDEIGNLKSWWESETDEHFKKKAQCIIEQYGNYTLPQVNLTVNGINTQGENIADNGGVKEAYTAYEQWVKVNGEEMRLPGLNYTTRQLFWISFANVWCSKTRPEAAALRIMTGVHSPQRFRVNGVVSNSPEFSNDFKCASGSPMNPVDKCVVW